MRLVRRETDLSPPVKYFYWPFQHVQGGTSFVDHLCYLCLVFVKRSRLFMAALWSPEGKGLTSWLLFMLFLVILLLSHSVSWNMCGTWVYRFLSLAVFFLFSKEEGKDQQSSTTPDTGYQMGKWQNTRKHRTHERDKRPAFSKQVITRLQGHRQDSITKTNTNTITLLYDSYKRPPLIGWNYLSLVVTDIYVYQW